MSIGTYGEPDAGSKAIGYAKFFSRSHNAVIRVYDAAGNVIETHGERLPLQSYRLCDARGSAQRFRSN
jgi:hypothetical protein